MPALKQSNTIEPTEVSQRSRLYHSLILGGAGAILIAGAVWRGGAAEQSPEGSEVTAIEALRKEVSGVQIALSRNELEVIRDAMTEISRDVAPSVVAIKPREEPVEPFRNVAVYGMPSITTDIPMPTRPRGISGLLIDKEGFIVTSASVLQYQFPVQVVFGSLVKTADLISADAARHIALLKLQDVPPGLVPADLSKAAEFVSGEWLVREGRAPAGDETRSLHLVESIHVTSSTERIGLLSNEAGSNMDGATLVNVASRVAGMYVHPSGSDGFVIPMRRAIEIAMRLKSNPGIAIRGWAGLELQELSEDLKEYFGAANGVLVSSVEANSPAAKSGLRPRDVIESVNDEEVGSPAAVMNIIGQSVPGTHLVFGIKRNSRQQKIDVTIAQSPANEPSGLPDEGAIEMRLRTTPDNGGSEILSIYPRSAANRLGLKAGDSIVSIDGRSVRNADQFWLFQRNSPVRKSQLWSIQRGDKRFFVAVKGRVIQR